jgi:hypothetical protein
MGEVNTYYYLGDRRVAMCKGAALHYIHQDHLPSTAVFTSDNGTQVGSIKYCPYASTRTDSVPKDVKFTGQKHDFYCFVG